MQRKEVNLNFIGGGLTLRNYLFGLILFFSIFNSNVVIAQRPIGEFYVRYYWDTNLYVGYFKQEIEWQTGIKIGLPWGPYTSWKVMAGPFFESSIISSGHTNGAHFRGSAGDFGGGLFINWLEDWTLTLKFSSFHPFQSADPKYQYISGQYNYLEMKYQF